MLFKYLYIKHFRLVIVKETIWLIERKLGSTFKVTKFLSNKYIFSKRNSESSFLSYLLSCLWPFLIFCWKNIS